MVLAQLATYRLTSVVQLILAQGSVLDFVPRVASRAALVNAANEGCLGGGGVDGAITAAGGPSLDMDRCRLPVLDGGIRCRTGSAVVTGPGNYGKLTTAFVIHAVGPNYWDYCDPAIDYSPHLEGVGTANHLLQSAYQEALDRAEENQLEQVAFALLSAGVYRGPVPLKDLLTTSVQAIEEWSIQRQTNRPLDITLCAFSPLECEVLREVCDQRLQ